MRYFSRLSFLFSIGFMVCSSFINAAENPAENKPKEGPELKVVNLAVYPAPITRPAMKYHLLPRLADQTPGNAASIRYNFHTNCRRGRHKGWSITRFER